MGLTKSELFTLEQNELAALAKVFAHPARIAIVQALLRANACVNGTLVLELGLAQATISQHLHELKQAGLIQGSIEGTRVSYCIDRKRWDEIQAKFMALFAQLHTSAPQSCA